ncbi:MAG: hypothetical protein WD314_16245 [Trueperaceae bacterium]
MNWQRIKEDWSVLREAARERWPELDGKTLEQAAGNRTALMEALQNEYGWTLERAGVEVDRWADTVSEHGSGETAP